MKEKVATLESLEDETQSGNMRESFSLEKVTLMSGTLRGSLEELEGFIVKGWQKLSFLLAEEMGSEFSHQKKTTAEKVRFPLHLIA